MKTFQTDPAVGRKLGLTKRASPRRKTDLDRIEHANDLPDNRSEVATSFRHLCRRQNWLDNDRSSNYCNNGDLCDAFRYTFHIPSWAGLAGKFGRAPGTREGPGRQMFEREITGRGSEKEVRLPFQPLHERTDVLKCLDADTTLSGRLFEKCRCRQRLTEPARTS